MKVVLNFIAKYFIKAEEYPTIRFIFEMFLISLIPKLFFLLIYIAFLMFDLDSNFLFGKMDESNASTLLSKMNWVEGLIFICVIAPLIETIIIQLIPISIASIIFEKRYVLILTSAGVFALLHNSQPFFALCSLFFTGIIYAWSFIVQRKKGYFKATLVTTAIHGLFNFVAYLSFYLIPDI
jgi:hypothetical protein